MTEPTTIRERLLLDAAEATRERGKSYGPPRDHFARTVGAINAVFAHKLKEPLTPADWGMFMVLDKIAREQNAPKKDNLVDVAGYAACVAEIIEQEPKPLPAHIVEQLERIQSALKSIREEPRWTGAWWNASNDLDRVLNDIARSQRP